MSDPVIVAIVAALAATVASTVSVLAATYLSVLVLREGKSKKEKNLKENP